MRSESSTRASPRSRRRSSPGPPEVNPDRGGLAPAFAAARARLGLIALLFALAGVAWWSTAERMRGMDAGPGTELGTLGWLAGVGAGMMDALLLPADVPPDLI